MARSVQTAEVQGHDGSDPTPMMSNVKVTPHDGGTPFEFNMLPDTGCTQSLMAADLASRHGMVINTCRRKTIRAVNDQKLDLGVDSGETLKKVRHEGGY